MDVEIRLSERQRQILEFLIDGVTIKEISLTLGISAGTISKHLLRVRKKTGARSLYQAIVILMTAGLLALDTPADQGGAGTAR